MRHESRLDIEELGALLHRIEVEEQEGPLLGARSLVVFGDAVEETLPFTRGSL
jgi:hypothetical protein